MGYQALLFCPDEKTARTVTQVLSELDFAVIPCTEPFAAVKKLMSEHFDAVVVDCDNEQNATLLFKSARNSPNNHSCLAVAVVEGQAGVAKAFRIGANLVLTKPVNVEQAKGTLRVARGLLRKSEAAKSAPGTAGAAVKAAMPAVQRPTPTVSAGGAAVPVAPSVVAAAAGISSQKSSEQPKVMVSVPSEINERDNETHVEILDEGNAEIVSASPVVPAVKFAASKPEGSSSSIQRPASSAGFGTSAASAPAPAREPKPIAAEHKASAVIAEPASPAEKVAASAISASIEEISAPAPSVSFGGAADGTKPAGGGSKKILLAVAAVVLVAVGGYEAWSLWGRGDATVPAHTAVQPATTAAKIPQVTPRAPVPVAAPSGTSSATSSTPDATEHAIASNKIVETEEPAAKTTAKPIAIKSGGARGGAKPAGVADAPAPSMVGIAAAGNSAALPSLMVSGKAPAPVLQNLNVSQGVSRGLLMKEIPPAYPATALHMRVEGAVELLATVTKSGDISAVKVLSGDPQLSHAAAQAVKQWKYKPYLLNGEPVEIQTQVTVKFKLPQ
jgi:protein TonB